MFLCDKRKLAAYNFYNRRKDLIHIKFFSLYNSNFSYKQTKYYYLADKQFIDYLKNSLNVIFNMNDEAETIAICIDTFPETLQGSIKLTNDIVLSFKYFLNDNRLSNLYKN